MADALHAQPNGSFARTTVLAQLAAVRPLQCWAVEFARCLGFGAQALGHIELLVEEAFTSVMHSAFEAGESGEITLELQQRPGVLVIALQDKGLPLDLQQLEESEALYLSFRLLRGLSDGLSLINLGKAGKRLELLKNLPLSSVAPSVPEAEQPPPAQTVESAVVASPPVALRLLEPQDALALAQLAYRTYGYTYASDFYYPDKIRQQLASGLLQCCAVTLDDGRLIACLCLFYAHAGAKVAESGAAMVEPRYRGLNLFKQLKQFLIAHGQAQGLYGLVSEAVTIHPYTQKGNLSLGARETGVLLSYIPSHVVFNKIDDKLQGQRQSAVYFYTRLNPEPLRCVFAPAVYLPLIERIHVQTGLRRQLQPAPVAALQECQGASALTLRVRSELFNDAVITVHRTGKDAQALVTHHLQQLCEKKVDVVYMDLPMASPAAMALAGVLAGKGFLFAGVLPEQWEGEEAGDVLRLQYLNHIAFDASRVYAHSPHAQGLLQAIAQQYQAARGQ